MVGQVHSQALQDFKVSRVVLAHLETLETLAARATQAQLVGPAVEVLWGRPDPLDLLDHRDLVEIEARLETRVEQAARVPWVPWDLEAR